MTTALTSQYREKTAIETQKILIEHTKVMCAAFSQMLGGCYTPEQIWSDICYQLKQEKSWEKAAEKVLRKYEPWQTPANV